MTFVIFGIQRYGQLYSTVEVILDFRLSQLGRNPSHSRNIDATLDYNKSEVSALLEYDHMLHVNYALWLQCSWISNLHQRHFIYYHPMVLRLKLHHFCSFKDKCFLLFFSYIVLCSTISGKGGHLGIFTCKNYLTVNLPPLSFMNCPIPHSVPSEHKQGSPKQHLAVLHLHPDKLVQKASTGVRLYIRSTITNRKFKQ